MKSQIVLIRHGITPGNIKKLYYGSTDLPLASEGEKRIRENVEKGIYPFSTEAEYYTSGMLRTDQTLRLIYGNKPREAIHDFRELHFGEFEMKSYQELNSRPEYRDWCNTFEDGTPPPGGESIRDFNIRVQSGLRQMLSRHQLLMLKLRHHEEEAMSICVCHGGVICSILNSIWPEKYQNNFYEWIPGPGYGYILKMKDGIFVDYEKL
ncbi:MAG: histidine phosphatase family protein [Eubacteriales bacterium]|nr:histidine phosphatase family protein [Eubacteriales bacterium]